MSEITCTNCRHVFDSQTLLCPYCGTAYAQTPQQSPASPIWPPPPQGYSLPGAAARVRLLTGRAWLDVTLGVLITPLVIGLTVAAGHWGFLPASVGVLFEMILLPILYFVMRPRYPLFGRGIGFGLLIPVAVLLGAVALCFYSIAGRPL